LIPLWRPMICATGAILVALPLDHHFRLLPRRSVVRWPLLALATFVGCYLMFAIPTLAVAGIVGLALRRRPPPSAEAQPRSRAPLAALAATSLAFLAATLVDRASTPCFWDAFVWLAKARYAAGGLGALVKGGLHTTVPPFIPSGYPLLEPLSVALLAGFSPRPESVVAGAIGLEILMTLLYLCAIADDERVSPSCRAKRLATVALALLASPLVLVHLRSAYVDLPLGLLVGAFAVLLPRPGAGVACAVVAVAAAALKDEGMVHIGAITLVGVLYGLDRRRDEALVRRSIACGLSAAAVMAAWHLRLRMSGIANTDHALSLPDWHRLSPLAKAALAHLFEVRSWGALGVLGVGGTVAVMVKPRSAPRDAAWFASLLLADSAVLFGALLATPGRVMEFATEGTLLNRLAMQLAPLAALLIAGWMASTPSRMLGQGTRAPKGIDLGSPAKCSGPCASSRVSVVTRPAEPEPPYAGGASSRG
jgi:hypothetical protein